MNPNNNDKASIDVNEILQPYLQKWYWFAISILVFIFGAIYYIYKKQPVYASATSILIKDAKKMSGGAGDLGALQGMMGLSSMGTNSIENELYIFNSKFIIEEVIKKLNLQTNIFAKNDRFDVILYNESNPVIINVISEKVDPSSPPQKMGFQLKGDDVILKDDSGEKEIKAKLNSTISLPFANIIIRRNPNFNATKISQDDLKNLYFQYIPYERLVEDYQKAVLVDLVDKDATIIGLSTESTSKPKSKDFLNEIVKQYNLNASSDKNFESQKTKDFIDGRISLIGKELGDVESQKESFKQKNNIVDITTETKLNLGTVAELEKQNLEFETQIALSDMLSKYLDGQNISQVLPSNIGLNSEAASSTISNYNKLVLERNKLLENATPDNPLVKDISAQITALKSGLRESLNKSRQNYQLSRNEITSKLNEVSGKVSAVPTQEKLFRNIERQQQLKENLYLLLLEKREEAAISLAMTADKARVIDKAYTTIKPVAPRKSIVLLIALALGFVLPLVYIFLKDLLKKNIVARKDIEKLTTNSIIGEIPRNNSKEQLIKLNDVSPLAEAFRILATNIQFMLPKNTNGKVIFVSSSVKGEGKTFVSINLALALANPTKKVVVVGSDIRNPQLQRYDVSKKNVKGLTEFLYGDADSAKEIIHASGINPQCDFIYSGSIPPNPTDLFQNGKYQTLINELRDIYDYIILDTAPLMLVTDSFLFADVADATVYVTRSEYSKKAFIEFANDKISSNKLKNVAFVLNDLKKANFGYSNTYGYGYTASTKKWWHFSKR